MTETGERLPEPAATETTAARLVLFDFDGVILRGDAFTLLVREQLRRGRWRYLPALAMALPSAPLLPFTRRPLRHGVVRAALMGLGEARYKALARRFGQRLARQPGRFHRDALTALRRHLAAGDRVVVVTGCETELVRAIFDELGLPDLPLVASRLKRGWVGMRMACHNVGAEKLRQLLAHELGERWDIAYSDSLKDLPMLRAADSPVLVNASPRLQKRATAALGREPRFVDWW
ncbi:haloacid dehalogenase-like hydrolase [Oleiagrimonas sp. C23AA]|uniref:HAD family hydrolase n=1 Tax=Oleiagrimonas sp. C23AA TaxID=2719047 RepID=UPI00141F3115|nr:haloacid dehalogenase-like hydrolase [Oleiagrimonas sp. C23AA]NII09761.1 haloacid dehalogenase-like hydrolase [Oleiagrimonas sp. C23AA]